MKHNAHDAINNAPAVFLIPYFTNCFQRGCECIDHVKVGVVNCCIGVRLLTTEKTNENMFHVNTLKLID